MEPTRVLISKFIAFQEMEVGGATEPDRPSANVQSKKQR